MKKHDYQAVSKYFSHNFPEWIKVRIKNGKHPQQTM